LFIIIHFVLIPVDKRDVDVQTDPLDPPLPAFGFHPATISTTMADAAAAEADASLPSALDGDDISFGLGGMSYVVISYCQRIFFFFKGLFF
jgi:hypothetical protein